MGITTPEQEMFDVRVDSRDHKVAKHMLESIGRDAAKVIMAPLKAIAKTPWLYLSGYVKEKNCPAPIVLNLLGGLAYACSGLPQTNQELLTTVALAFGAAFLPCISVKTVQYLQTKHQEALTAVYGMPAL